MSSPIKTKKISISRGHKNAKTVSSVKNKKLPQMVKSNLGRKISSVEIRKKHLKKRKKSTKKISENNNRKVVLVKTAFGRKRPTESSDELHESPRPDPPTLDQNKPPRKDNSLKFSENCNKSSSSIQKFVYLGNIDEEKRRRNKFRKPANGRELKRLRKKLWNKSSYHKRFLGKSGFVKSQKTEKCKGEKIKRRRKRLRTTKEFNLRKSGVKNTTDGNVPTGKKNSQQSVTPNELSSQKHLDNEKKIKIESEIRPSDSNKSSKEDVSKVDENYIKSLLLIANYNIKSEFMESKHQREDCCSNAEDDKMTDGLREMKKSETTLTSSHESDSHQNCREKTNNAGLLTLRDATKSETQLKLWKRKTADVKNREIKNKRKRARSKHEIISHQQKKKKNRNILKNKTEGNTETSFPCEALRTEEVKELWKREKLEKCRIPQSSDSSSTIAENANGQNVKGLGMESYQLLKRFVEEEIFRISHKGCKNATHDMKKNDPEMCKERRATTNKKQLSSLARKKLAANFPEGEKHLQNAETVDLANLLHGGKPIEVKSKPHLREEKKDGNKKTPDEIIKNWSIVNRLEQAFLALGTPDFRKMKAKEPATTKGTRTMKRNDKKPGLNSVTNKQKDIELKKSTIQEKQVSVSHKKETTTGSRKLGTPYSMNSTKFPKTDAKIKPKEEKVRIQPLCLPQPCRPQPVIRPTAKLTKWGIKAPTHGENLCNTQNQIEGSRQIGKLGKKNSSRNHSYESSTQNKNDDDNLERKKTFHIISLKDSVIMQPRRSKSCNKVDRNSEVDRKNSVSSTGSHECKNMTSFSKHEQNLDFWNFFNKTEKTRAEEEFRNNEIEMNQKDVSSASKDVAETSERSTSDLVLNPSKEEKKCEEAEPPKLSEPSRVWKEVNCGSKTRAIKERSILSIRRNQQENQTSPTNIPQIQEECTTVLFQADVLDLSKTSIRTEGKKKDVFLSPINANYSATSCISTATYDLARPMPESSVNVTQIATNDDGLELLKAPRMSSSESVQAISSQTSTTSSGIPETVKNAPWEEDMTYYRALVREIMSQYKRLDGFLKQSENVNGLPKDWSEVNTSGQEVGLSKEEFNIQEYREKIMSEYQQIPIFEYKSKMYGLQDGADDSKGRKLVVVRPGNAGLDLDVKDYEPRMRTVLGARLYFDKENFTRRQQINKNPKERWSSLQDVILGKPTKPENDPRAIFTPKSCLCNLDAKQRTTRTTEPEQK